MNPSCNIDKQETVLYHSQIVENIQKLQLFPQDKQSVATFISLSGDNNVNHYQDLYYSTQRPSSLQLPLSIRWYQVYNYAQLQALGDHIAG